MMVDSLKTSTEIVFFMCLFSSILYLLDDACGIIDLNRFVLIGLMLISLINLPLTLLLNTACLIYLKKYRYKIYLAISTFLLMVMTYYPGRFIVAIIYQSYRQRILKNLMTKTNQVVLLRHLTEYTFYFLIVVVTIFFAGVFIFNYDSFFSFILSIIYFFVSLFSFITSGLSSILIRSNKFFIFFWITSYIIYINILYFYPFFLKRIF